jgi:hypothetical protein
MLDVGRPFKTFFRGVHSLDEGDDDDDQHRQGRVLRKPITLPRMEWESDDSFRLFARSWRVGNGQRR